MHRLSPARRQDFISSGGKRDGGWVCIRQLTSLCAQQAKTSAVPITEEGLSLKLSNKLTSFQKKNEEREGLSG